MKNINHEDSAPDLPAGKHQKCSFLPSYLQLLSGYYSANILIYFTSVSIR